MRFIDTHKEYLHFQKQIEEAREKVIKSGSYLLGRQTRLLEEEFSQQIVPGMNCTAVKNCTDAIIMVVERILQERPDAPIILPNFGAYPTAIAASNVTQNLHYVDVDETYTIDADLLPGHLRDGVVIPVHLFGNNCNMKKINEYASLNNHIVIEDCAQSTGSGSGVEGDYSVFSFYPTKPLASMGDGGMICSKSADNDNHFQKYRFYGQDFKTRVIEFVGVNSRIDEFQASVVRAKLKGFHDLNDKRIMIAKRYKNHVRGMKTRGKCVYHQFPVRFSNRDEIIEKMSALSIPHVVHYGNHVCDYAFLNPNNYKVRNRISESIVSFPCHPFMTEEEIQKVERFLSDVKTQEL